MLLYYTAIIKKKKLREANLQCTLWFHPRDQPILQALKIKKIRKINKYKSCELPYNYIFYFSVFISLWQ